MQSNRIGIGIIGCGTISDIYLTNLTTHFPNVEVLACADMFPEKAAQTAQKFGIPKACTVAELLADDKIRLVANLTIPAAHHAVNMQILEAGRHLYCEKPMSLSLADAEAVAEMAATRGLLAGSAPDTFLGAGQQTARKLLDAGRIGRPTAFTANLVSPGHELWHPNPGFYYQKGGGPMLDMGPYYLTALVHLFGPIRQISCLTNQSRATREILGKPLDVEVPTHYAGVVEFESGLIGNVTMSFDVWHSKLPQIEVFGTDGMMTVPDPNQFGGLVQVFDGLKMQRIVRATEGPHIQRLIRMHTCAAECLEEVPHAFPAEDNPRSNMRGFGISEMAGALLSGRRSRLTPELSRHVVEALLAFDVSSREGRPCRLTTTCERPAPMPEGLPLWGVE